jgi:hypothetical protein
MHTEPFAQPLRVLAASDAFELVICLATRHVAILHGGRQLS